MITGVVDQCVEVGHHGQRHEDENHVEPEVVEVEDRKANGQPCDHDEQQGDRIVFGKYSGTEIKVEGEERLILREDDILGVID